MFVRLAPITLAVWATSGVVGEIVERFPIFRIRRIFLSEGPIREHLGSMGNDSMNR